MNRSLIAEFASIRVDILYVHDICVFVDGGRAGSDARIRELMDTGGSGALTELRDSGQVKAMGAGVNERESCARLLEFCRSITCS